MSKHRARDKAKSLDTSKPLVPADSATPNATALNEAVGGRISKLDYKLQLHDLQVGWVKLQRHVIHNGERILILLEGRDAPGKDGGIKRIVEYLSPRETRVVALGKPSDRERGGWYLQRYVAHLPVAEEFVLFNRSWYNRAGVEHVMGFCSKDEHEEFMQSVTKFEEMLIHAGIKLLKYYLDVDKDEQERRLHQRLRDPLKQWKSSPANLIRHILSQLHCDGKKKKLVQPEPQIAFEFTADYIGTNRLAY